MLNPLNINFGKRIKKLRQKHGVTQEKLAELTKTSYKYIQRIEGKNPPDIRITTAKRIADALKITLSKLLNF